ncbi:putative Histidine kinase [Syntrophobacter sp. SbD1]|nr:putative Histidine kinase [Syntrophobacter sp. SbD1]
MGRALKKQKTAEESLYDSEGKFRDLAEKSLAGIYLIQNGVIRYANPRFSEIFGYTVEEMTDKMRPQDTVLPEDWPLVNENIRRRTSGEVEALHYEFRGVRKSGEIINTEVYGSHTTYRGKPAVIGTMLDITKRKRAEELIRQAEEKYRSIFENAMEGIFQITPQGQFIVVNPAFKKMLGFNCTEEHSAVPIQRVQQLFAESAYQEFMHALESDGIVQGFVCEFYRKDTEKIWVSINARAVRDNDDNTLCYEGTIEDITEEKKAKDELRRLNEFSSAIIKNASVAIFTLDKDGTFTSVNPALASLFGLGPEAEEKLIGFNWLQDLSKMKCGLAGYIESGLRGEPFQLWDSPYKTYGGERNVYMDFKGIPLKGKDGAVEGLLCIIEETTARVKTQTKLMEQARMLIVGRLAAGIAAELNNPLAALVAHSELADCCLKDLEDSLQIREHPVLDELKSCLNTIEANAFRCKSVTSDIIGLPWKEGLEDKEIDVNRLLSNILERDNINRSGACIVTEMSLSLPAVRGDITALRQVFMNLISNAVDAVEGRAEATIYIRTKFDDNEVLVEIEDNGAGIPDLIADKIFEPFFTTKGLKRGVGLGLPLCEEFLSQMGGTIGTESKPGCGTIFVVRLPVQFPGKTGEYPGYGADSHSR